ncbi:MAG: hypothetical protein ACFFAE_20950, partial [Candidatus Hodarchaeota archaeon]
KCKGKKQLTCKTCDGKKKREIEVTVLEYPGKKKKKQTFTQQCDECFGDGIFPCPLCGGSGGAICKKCDGTGKRECKECKGTGIFYQFTESLVPFVGGEIDHFFIPPKYSSKKLELKKKKQEMGDLLSQAGAADFQSLGDLNEKNLENQFSGFKFDKDGKKQLDETRKAFENLQKAYDKRKASEKPLLPIRAHPIIRLEVKTPKGKGFQIYSVGTDSNFFVIEE